MPDDPVNNPVIPEAVKAQIGKEAVESYKASLPKAPEKFEVKIPDGSSLSPEVLDRATAIARDLGVVSHEHAQRLVDFTNSEAKAVAERIAKDYSPGGSVFEEHRKQYTEEALKAPDLGNGSPEALQAKVALATTFTNKYFPEKVRQLINDTGIGNHPDFFRAILNIGAALKEDGFVGGPAGKQPRSLAERIYNKQKA